MALVTYVLHESGMPVPLVPLATPIFGRSFNPIPTGESRLFLPITYGTSKFFHLTASLDLHLMLVFNFDIGMQKIFF